MELSEFADIFMQAGCYPRIFQRGTLEAIVQLARILSGEGVAPAAAESSVLLVEGMKMFRILEPNPTDGFRHDLRRRYPKLKY